MEPGKLTNRWRRTWIEMDLNVDGVMKRERGRTREREEGREKKGNRKFDRKMEKYVFFYGLFIC